MSKKSNYKFNNNMSKDKNKPKWQNNTNIINKYKNISIHNNNSHLI